MMRNKCLGLSDNPVPRYPKFHDWLSFSLSDCSVGGIVSFLFMQVFLILIEYLHIYIPACVLAYLCECCEATFLKCKVEGEAGE